MSDTPRVDALAQLIQREHGIDDDLEQRVAAAIWGADENAHETFWHEVSDRWRAHYTRLAQVAIATIRRADRQLTR